MKTLATILEAVTGRRDVHGDASLPVAAIRYDSREVRPGDLFVAINGRDDRGLDFVGAAVAAGAAAVVTDAPDRIDPHLLDRGPDAAPIALVVVDDARRAMAAMANALLDFPARRRELFGVTGTNGKTTTTFVLQQLLAASGRSAGVIGTLGSMIDQIVPTGYTTPEAPELVSILAEMSRAGLDSVAMEVSSHALALHRVAGLDFHGAIFTNLTQDHLDFHDSLQSYRDAKKSLFDGLDAGRPAVVNVDDLQWREMVRDCHGRVFGYGSTAVADALVAGVRLDAGGSSWDLKLSEALGGGVLELRSPLIGAFNVANVTAACTLALAIGIGRDVIAEAVSRLQPVPGRMESVQLPNGPTVVVDYAHSPDALANVLSTLRGLRAPNSRIITVFGCGGDRDRLKRPKMGAIAAELSDEILVTSDNPRTEEPDSIIDQIVEGIPADTKSTRIVDRAEAIDLALERARREDIVLVAGKGHETYQIVGHERHHFDDREVVREMWMKRIGKPDGGRESA